MKNRVMWLAILFLVECFMVRGAQKSVAQPPSSVITELEDILLVQGLAGATTKLQHMINGADGLRDAALPEAVKNPKKSGKAKPALALASPLKIEARDQEAMEGFLQQYVQRLELYIEQGGAIATPAVFDQGMQCLVNIVRTPLLSEKGKDFLTKTVLPKLKVRALDAKEVDAWLTIRPLFASYQQQSGRVENFHPLQDGAVKALQSALVQCKSKQVHYATVRQLQEAVELVIGAVLCRQQRPVLTKLASLDQFQQLAAAIADNEVLSAESKVVAKTILESFMGALGNVRAATTMITTQLAADQNAAPLVKIANAMGYMNKCDIALKGLRVAQDVYVDEGMQKLRNAYAQSLVDMQKKIVPETTKQFVALLQRAADTGLLGKAQRSYVLTQMLPAFDSELMKKTRVAAMQRFGKQVVKTKAKK